MGGLVRIRKAVPAVLFFLSSMLILAAAPAGASPVTIRALLWSDSPGGPLRTVLAHAVKRFNLQNAGLYTVVPQWAAPANATATLSPLMSSGQAPDVFMTSEAALSALSGSGAVYSLSPALTADPFWRARFPAGALQPLTFAGRVLAAPAALRVGVLYYNTAFFSRDGLPPPHTVSDLSIAIKSFTGDGITPIAIGGEGGREAAVLAQQVAVRDGGSSIFDHGRAGTAEWTNPAMVRAAGYLEQLTALGAFPLTQAHMSDAQAVATFETGHAAMLFSSDPRLLVKLDSIKSPIRGHVDGVPFPVLSAYLGGSQPWVGTPEINLAIDQRSAVKQAALLFIKSFSSPSTQVALARAGFLPVTTQAVDLAKTEPLMYGIRQYTRTMAAMTGQYSDILDPAQARDYQASIANILARRDPDVVLAELNTETSPRTE